jgi:FtsP/CotA-like multicopper oxidase with cupredoxin domain
MLSRRELMAGFGGIASAAIMGRARLAIAQEVEPFSSPLPVPPLLDARRQGNRVKITAREGRHTFSPGIRVTTYGYSADYLGPAMKVYRGDTVQIEVENKIDRPTTVHWHGLLVPARDDGGPRSLIERNQVWRPEVKVDQPEATAWFHAHPHHDTARQVYMGLAGLMLIEDGTGMRLGLPRDYGVDDLPLILQDRQFDAAGRLVYFGGGPARMMGMRGDTVLVNGTIAPNAKVPAGIVRLRFLNAANARNFDLSFADGRIFHVIAGDGGYLPRPVAMRSLLVAPGERFEVLIDFSDGRPAVLQAAEDDFSMGMMGPGMMGQPFGRRSPGSGSITRFEVDTTLPIKAKAVPPALGTRVAPDRNAAVGRRRLTLDMGMMGMGMGGSMASPMGINGYAFDPRRIDIEAKVGTAEIWSVAPVMMAHPFHIHGVMFNVLSLGGRPPPAHLAGAKDTVLLREPAELLVHFTQAATRDKPFVYHCHILEHEEAGMMGQYTAT